MNNSFRVLSQTAEDELKAPLSGALSTGDGGGDDEGSNISGGSKENISDDDQFEVEVTIEQGYEDAAALEDDLKSGKETATLSEGSTKSGDDEIGGQTPPPAGYTSIKKLTDDEASTSSDEKQEKNPWTLPFVGIPVNYFSVGVILGGSVSVLYPILIIQHGVTSSFYSAAASLVTLFWSYKIIFGILCDCFPIMGRKWKPYIVLGWVSTSFLSWIV